MADIADGVDVVDLIAGYSSVPDHWQPIMREVFTSTVGSTEGEIDEHALVNGLAQAVFNGVWGFWLDHYLPDTITAEAAAFVDVRVGVPDSSDGYEAFAYSGTSVAEGIHSFDRWLQNDHIRHRQALIDDGEDAAAVDGRLKNLRLIQVVNSSNFYLAIAHPAKAIPSLIERLGNLGLHAKPVPASDPDRAQRVAPQTGGYNVSEFLESQLIERFGFTGSGSSLVRWTDDQHAVIAYISPFERGANAGGRAGISFALARRDINDLQAEIINPTWKPHYPVTSEDVGNRFANRPDGHWLTYTSSQQGITEYLTSWVPRILELTNFAFIIDNLYLDDPRWNDQVRGQNAHMTWIHKSLNKMLDGWRPEIDDQLFEERLDRIKDVADEEIHAQANREIEAMRSWITNNPDGITRALT